MSRCLFNCGIEHLVFERGTIGGRWQSHARDSLRLLTPNWMNLLPDAPYEGDDLDGFMLRDDHVARLRDYAAAFGAPVMEQTAVTSLTHGAAGFRIEADRGIWRAGRCRGNRSVRSAQSSGHRPCHQSACDKLAFQCLSFAARHSRRGRTRGRCVVLRRSDRRSTSTQRA
ncbi:hypothetical protein SAMN02927900_02670 [Rhizobium mongolense subsp. loessense]|uniref:Uncharacterized protein n=1 Tax=Rhizobium mongolense subsp. loessense TaxID=158890 RepID=A0A1G4RHA6_9HYPH|nr:hypothetical protein SAMN02927900_02670 [Rhizobium mongolense subsp. loessense]